MESILRYGREIWTVDHILKKELLRTGMDFRRTAARKSKTLQVRNYAVRNKKTATQIIMKRLGSNMLKLYGHVLRVVGNRWHKEILTWSLEEIK